MFSPMTLGWLFSIVFPLWEGWIINIFWDEWSNHQPAGIHDAIRVYLVPHVAISKQEQELQKVDQIAVARVAQRTAQHIKKFSWCRGPTTQVCPTKYEEEPQTLVEWMVLCRVSHGLLHGSIIIILAHKRKSLIGIPWLRTKNSTPMNWGVVSMVQMMQPVVGHADSMQIPKDSCLLLRGLDGFVEHWYCHHFESSLINTFSMHVHLQNKLIMCSCLMYYDLLYMMIWLIHTYT